MRKIEIPVAGVSNYTGKNGIDEGKIVKGRRVKFVRRRDNDVDKNAIAAYIRIDGDARLQQIGFVATDYVGRVGRMIDANYDGKEGMTKDENRSISGKIVGWYGLNGDKTVEKSTVFVEAVDEKDVATIDAEVELAGRFEKCDCIMPTVKMTVNEYDIGLLWEEMQDCADDEEMVKLGKSYLEMMGNSLAWEDREYHIRIEDLLMRRGDENADIQDVTENIRHKRHWMVREKKAPKMMEEMICHTKGNGAIEAFKRLYPVVTERGEVLEKIRMALWKSVGDSYAKGEESKMAYKVFYGRFKREDVYTLLLYKVIYERFAIRTKFQEVCDEYADISNMTGSDLKKLMERLKEEEWIPKDCQPKQFVDLLVEFEYVEAEKWRFPYQRLKKAK